MADSFGIAKLSNKSLNSKVKHLSTDVSLKTDNDSNSDTDLKKGPRKAKIDTQANKLAFYVDPKILKLKKTEVRIRAGRL